MTTLVKYEAACRSLAEAHRVDEVKDIHDKAEAMRVYAIQSKNVDLEIMAVEIRDRSERRLGEMIKAGKEDGTILKGRPKKVSDSESFSHVVLADIGIDPKLSMRSQKLAGIADRAFEEMVARKRQELAGRHDKLNRELLKEEDVARRKAEHAARAFEGGQVEHLVALAASGFKAAAILADPPWHFVARSEKGDGRSAGQHYTTDRTEGDKIKSLPVAALAADNCVLFMWMVDWCPSLALAVIEAWGFAHKTTAFTWAKQTESGEGWHMGQGYWTRANPEDCWLATRGQPKRINADVRQLIIHPIMEHSRKPDEIHDRIERLVEGPYLELYARRERRGWKTWGNELSPAALVLPPHDPETGEVLDDPPQQDSAMTDDRTQDRSPRGNQTHPDDGLNIPDFLKRTAGERV